ncbi:SDR family NAD(P)-dependent oxidoreductase [Paenibacillus nasutitermitis]|uniref:Short-chain dehydrogenase n=1 Tax=Paenibacillus nasutitermitis TaxID=1652958 RepID=A0A917E1I2_9BACL|nr:SDR family oxidoreductase [Paenibacillus nasutitermitis]GGD89352.1 short-chain dehydrogenase [Paenibacillus nasutitermitis]
MNMLQDKVIWITGAMGKLGQSAVKMFLQRGAIVVAHDILALEGLPDLVQIQKQYGSRFLSIVSDAASEEGVENAAARIKAKVGRLHGLYHNVYTQHKKPVLELTLDEWENVLRGSLTSAFLTAKYAIPLMIESGGGVIVNTSSVLGHRPTRGCPAYSAAKAGLNQFTKVLAVDYAEHGIRANAIVPGDIKTEENLRALGTEFSSYVRERTLLGRSGTPDEVSELAAYLLSDAASYTTGALYSIDGGFQL